MRIEIIKKYVCKCGKEDHPHTYGIRKKELHTKGNFKSFEAIFEMYCCKDMEEAIREDFIKFGEFDSMGMNKVTYLNIFHCSPYPEGACWDEMAIKYCPFCGEKITFQKETEK